MARGRKKIRDALPAPRVVGDLRSARRTNEETRARATKNYLLRFGGEGGGEENSALGTPSPFYCRAEEARKIFVKRPITRKKDGESE